MVREGIGVVVQRRLGMPVFVFVVVLCWVGWWIDGLVWLGWGQLTQSIRRLLDCY